jgi:hypothetical protein
MFAKGEFEEAFRNDITHATKNFIRITTISTLEIIQRELPKSFFNLTHLKTFFGPINPN